MKAGVRRRHDHLRIAQRRYRPPSGLDVAREELVEGEVAAGRRHVVVPPEGRIGAERVHMGCGRRRVQVGAPGTGEFDDPRGQRGELRLDGVDVARRLQRPQRRLVEQEVERDQLVVHLQRVVPLLRRPGDHVNHERQVVVERADAGQRGDLLRR
jgi:hypothetical protein